jgi:hypothetical protein
VWFICVLLSRTLDAEPTLFCYSKGDIGFSNYGMEILRRDTLETRKRVKAYREGTWALMDPQFGGESGKPERDFASPQLRRVFGTSPQPNLYKEWAKLTRAEVWIMNPFSMREYLTAA